MNIFTKTFFRVMLAALAAVVVDKTFGISNRISSNLG
jgi:hypothetical protein